MFSQNSYSAIKMFYEDVKQKWISPGNEPANFAYRGCKIVIILENASFHKKAEILEKIAAEMPNLVLEFLPKYSPDYNLAELV